MQNEQMARFIELLHDDVQRLPAGAVPLAAALVRDEEDLPVELRNVLLSELGKRGDTQVLSPAAEAVIRLRRFSRYQDLEPVLKEVEAHYTLLRALRLTEAMYEALDFLTQLADHIQEVTQPTASPVAPTSGP